MPEGDWAVCLSEWGLLLNARVMGANYEKGCTRFG